MNSFVHASLITALTAGLLACGGGGGGGSASGSSLGSSAGTLTGFGSVIINDRGRFETATATVEIDDSPSSESELKLGMHLQVDISGTDDNFTNGNADRVLAFHEVKGPVTGLNPLEVFGQTVVITGDTLVQDSSQDGRNSTQTINPASLSLGDEVEVSGRRDDQGIIQASRLELKLGGLAEWKLVGRVSGISGSTFAIGNQNIDIGALSARDCVGGLMENDRVEIEALPQAFTPGFTLTSVTDVECKPDQLVFGGTATGVIQGEFEGFVTSVASGSFTLGDQTVTWNSSTLFEGGGTDDIVTGVKLDARGAFNLSTGILAANRIRFRETRFRLEGPAVLTATDGVSLLGLIINTTAQTDDDDNLIGSSAANQQIRVRGFVDSNGSLFASEVDDRGSADLSDTRVRGAVDSGSIDRGANTFTLFGITIDANSAVVFRFSDQITPISQETFMNALSAGVEVDAEDGTYNSGSHTITNAKLEIQL